MNEQVLRDLLALVKSPEDKERVFDYVTIELDPKRVYRKTSMVVVFKGEEGGTRLIWYGPEGQLERRLVDFLKSGSLQETSHLVAIKYYDGSRWDVRFRKKRGGEYYITAGPAKFRPQFSVGQPPSFVFLK
jgi:hypothetical protein